MTVNHEEIDFELGRMKKKILELEKLELSNKAEVKEAIEIIDCLTLELYPSVTNTISRAKRFYKKHHKS